MIRVNFKGPSGELGSAQLSSFVYLPSMNRKCKLVATSSNSLCVYFLYSQSLTAIRKIVSANSNLHHLSLPDLPPIFETPGPRTQRRGSMDYSGSPTVTRNAVVEEVGIEEAPGCAEENIPHQNVDVSMSEEAIEQAKCLILYFSIHSFSFQELPKRGHRRGISDTSTIDFR